MLSVIVPTLNAEAGLPRTLAPLVPAAADGLVRQVVITDGGSTDATVMIADETGCDLVSAPRGRGTQLAAGARHARADWLLFLHADTTLDEGWIREASAFIEATEAKGRDRAAVFRFRLDDYGFKPWLLERLVAFRCALFAMPYGDQGLLISRRLYDEIGGYRPVPLMEDVDLVRRIGRRRLAFLRTAAVTSPERYRREGYFRRMARNLGCLTLYFLRVPPRVIVRLYG
ncbi:MAG: TIGR04283 family arsenosugar biosynthesis glycosyltransferase [Pseudomonadota bacterium]